MNIHSKIEATTEVTGVRTIIFEVSGLFHSPHFGKMNQVLKAYGEVVGHFNVDSKSPAVVARFEITTAEKVEVLKEAISQVERGSVINVVEESHASK